MLDRSTKMHSNVACRFSRRNRDGEEGEALLAEDEIGAWRSSPGACRRTDARSHCTESCAISSQSSKVGDEVRKTDEEIRGSAFRSREADEHGVSWRRNTGDRFFCGSKSVSSRNKQAESYFDSNQHGKVLGYEILGNRLGKSVGALGGLADSRVGASCIVDDCASEVFSQNAMRSGTHADFSMNTFNRLDERASEVLRKSMQALERSYYTKSGSCMSAGPEQRRWALNVCEQGCFVPLRRGELTESSGDANLRTKMGDLRDLISNSIEVLREVHVPRELVGAFSDNSCTYDTKKPGDYFTGSQEDQPSSYIPPVPEMWDDCQAYSGVKSNVMDYGTDENKEGSTRRICRWARLPAINLTTGRNSISSQIPSHVMEDLNVFNGVQGCIVHKNHYDIPENTQEEEYDTRLIHHTPNNPAIRREEKSICHSKLPESVDRWVEMQDCKRRDGACVSDVTRGLASSLQGVRVASSSGVDTLQHEPTVEKGQHKVDTSGQSVQRTEACALPAKTQECENPVGTEVQHETLHEEKKLANLKLHRSVTVEEHLQDEAAPGYFCWGAEGDGCMHTGPSMPSKIHEAQNVSASSDNNLESDISSGDKGKFHPNTKSLPAISVTSLPWQTAMDALRSARQPKPLASSRKMLPIIVISPPRVSVARGSYRRVAKGLKSHSEDTKGESPRIDKVVGRTEIIRQQNSPKAPPHNVATTITVNISVTPTERSGETNPTNSIRVHSSGKSAESKSTQTPKPAETVQNPTKRNRQLLAKSSLTVEPSTQKPLKIKFRPINKASTILKESSPAEKLQTSRRKLRPQGDEGSKARTSLNSDTWPSSGELQRGSAGLRHWPDVIPELDNWISEVVSEWLGTEDGLLRNDPENTLVKVSSGGTASVINVRKNENHAASLKLSSLHGHKTPPSLRVTKVGKLLDIQMKRLEDIDSRVSKAHSVDDLFRILEGVSTI